MDDELWMLKIDEGLSSREREMLTKLFFIATETIMRINFLRKHRQLLLVLFKTSHNAGIIINRFSFKSSAPDFTDDRKHFSSARKNNILVERVRLRCRLVYRF